MYVCGFVWLWPDDTKERLSLSSYSFSHHPLHPFPLVCCNRRIRFQRTDASVQLDPKRVVRQYPFRDRLRRVRIWHSYATDCNVLM